MREVAAIILLASVAQADAVEVATNHTGDTQDKTAEKLVDQESSKGQDYADKLVEKLADKLVGNFFNRAQELVASRAAGVHADLDNTTLGKQGNLATAPRRILAPPIQAALRTCTQPIPGAKPVVRAQGPMPGMMGLDQTKEFLFQQRMIQCVGEVNDGMSTLLVAQMLYLDSQDTDKDIKMYINSPGGSVTAGMGIFDLMNHIRPDVSTCCAGLAASMGAFLLAAGHPGKRYGFPSSRIMIHQPLGGAQGQAADIEIQANEIMHHKMTLNGYLAQFTGQSLDTITKDTDRDFFMSAAEAAEYGLIDEAVPGPKLEATPS